MDTPEINQGDPLLVADPDGTTWEGVAVTVNAKLVHIAYPGWPEPQPFRRDSQQASHRNNGRTFQRPGETDTERRRRQALITLREHGLGLFPQSPAPSLKTLEAAARAVSEAEAEPAFEPITYDPNLED